MERFSLGGRPRVDLGGDGKRVRVHLADGIETRAALVIRLDAGEVGPHQPRGCRLSGGQLLL